MPDEDRSTMERAFARLVRRPIAVAMFVLALLGTSVIAAMRIPIELQPDGFASSQIQVFAPWNGANPREIERQVVLPLEEELRTIRGVSEVIAFASPGSGGVIVSFPGSFDMDLAYAEVADRVERVRPRLPRDADRVTIRRWTTADMPIMWAGVSYDPEHAERAQDTLSELLQPRIEALDGVASVDVRGLQSPEISIWLDEELVRAQGVDIGALVGRLQQDNLSAPVGDLDEAGSRILVRVDSRFETLEDIENFPVRDGLKIKDIGRVILGREEAEGMFRVDGDIAVGMAITKESSANTFEVCKSVVHFLEEEAPKDPALSAFEYQVFWNSGSSIENSLSSLVKDAAIGGLIACVVLMLFLRRFRFTLLIACSIPFSVLVTLSYLYFTGDTFNLFTMMGITVSIGMLVDNSVVIVESIFKRRERGESVEQAVTRGPSEVMLAVVTATLTSVVVFLPLIFMSENRNARTFTTAIGVPLCVSLLAALLLAVVIVPVTSRYLSRGQQTVTWFDRMMPSAIGRSANGITRRLQRLVDWSLRNRFAAMLIAFAFVASGMQAGMSSQMSGGLAGFGSQMRVPFDLSASTTLEKAGVEAEAIEEALEPIRGELGDPTIGVEFSKSSGVVNLWFDEDVSPEREEELRELLKATLPRRAALEYKFEDDFNKQNTEDENWTRVMIEGPDSETVLAITDDIRARAKASGLFKDVAKEDDPVRVVQMTLDRDRMQRLGVNSQEVLGTVEWTLRGFMVSRMETDRADIPIMVEFDEGAEPTRARLSEMTVKGLENGAPLALNSIASFEHQRGLRGIYRENGKTSDVVGLKGHSKDLKKLAADVRTMMAGVTLPEGYRWRQSGGWGDFQDDMSELIGAFVLAICLVFFLMGLLFESLLLPFSVLFTIPFAVAGANWSFLLTGTPLDLIGMVGMIVLAGVVVNNGIVLVDKIVRLRNAGMDRREAVLQGVGDRIRPVFMTAATTIVGLLPIAFSTSSGNSFSFQGLAIGVAGGLACTTFFTLWIVPVAYTMWDDLQQLIIRLLGVVPAAPTTSSELAPAPEASVS